MAREQGALFWELRAALSLARLKATQGRPEEAKRVLTPVYDRFTEGFETADLRAARAMLELPMTGFAAGESTGISFWSGLRFCWLRVTHRNSHSGPAKWADRGKSG